MKKSYQYLVLTLAVFACETGPSQPVVTHHGTLREIMMEQKLEANAALSDIKGTPNLYALGALEGLSGEVLILNGKPLNGLVVEGRLSLDRSFDRRATLLVSSQVEAWHEVTLRQTFHDLTGLQSAIAHEAQQVGLVTTEAFPFLLKGTFERIDWHVIHASGTTARDHEAYKQAGLNGTSKNTEAQVLGFYSQKHEGIFTHHGSFLHMHFINTEETAMGHVDHLKTDRPLMLLLPKTTKP